MGRRLYSRQPNGRFRRATLENTFGLSAPSCPTCQRLNPYKVTEPPPENCHACGSQMDPDISAEGDDGKVYFDHLEYSTSRREWIAWTKGDAMSLKGLVGKIVNIGTKDGMVYENTTVTSLDQSQGLLTIEGGRCGGRPVMEPGESDPVDEPEVIGPYDIARGYIHPEA